MRFLLTSAGITNKNIADSILELVEKSPNEISVLFITTAANMEVQDDTDDWLRDDIQGFIKQGYKQVDVLDIAGISKEEWLPHFEAADLICFGGGNEQYLAKVMHTSGLTEILPDLLRKKVYMGISAGSMVVGQFLPHDLMKIVYPEESFEELAPSLAYVNYIFVPHLNSEFFQHVRKEVIEQLQPFTYPVYACDDNSALKIIHGRIEIIGEGEVLVF